MKTLHPHIELLETRIAPAALGTLDLSSLNGVNGFKIQGEAAKDLSGHSVSTAGDVNGDGFADLIIGAPYDSANGTNSGASYVVFGKAGGFTAPLNLSALDGTNGFKILGEMPNDQSGSSVSGAGDVNDDGVADLIIGAPTGFPSNGAFASTARYVVFGKAGGFSPTLNLSTLNGTNGFKMQGGSDYTGYAVSGAGDVNGDGFADVV